MKYIPAHNKIELKMNGTKNIYVSKVGNLNFMYSELSANWKIGLSFYSMWFASSNQEILLLRWKRPRLWMVLKERGRKV